jgi:hypothetical protein
MGILIPEDLFINLENEDQVYSIIRRVSQTDFDINGQLTKDRAAAKKELKELGEYKIAEKYL